MLQHKIRAGVLHLQTPSGLRCIPLTITERILLIWVFRHFTILPEQVLGNHSLRLLNQILNDDRPYQRCTAIHPEDRDAVIGTVECQTLVKKGPQSELGWRHPNVAVLRPTPRKN